MQSVELRTISYHCRYCCAVKPFLQYQSLRGGSRNWVPAMLGMHCLGQQQRSPFNLLNKSTLLKIRSERRSLSKTGVLSPEPVSILWSKRLPAQSSGVTPTVASSRQAQTPVVSDEIIGGARAQEPVVNDEKIGGAGGVELTEYSDSWLDLLFINGCRKAFGRVANWQSPRSWEDGYRGMVEVSHALMRGKTATQQQDAVLQGFPRVPDWFRKLFPSTDWGAELNARITPLFFEWLVGPCEVVEVQVGDKVLKSGVQIKKCRYLETSGCTGMCVNLCKVPTQYFFTAELGMPLTMEPNFEDLSCKMIFGQAPPSLEADPALKQGCFNTCPSASETIPCPKLR